MSRRSRITAGFALACMLPLLTAGPVAGQDASSSSFDRIASCVADGGRLLLLAVVDESASLKQTDPTGIRVDALETVVRNVAQLGDRVAGASSVEIGFAGFATDFEMLRWSPANATTAQDLSEAARTFASRDNGIDTDFAAAFVGARDALDSRAAEVAAETGERPCKVLLTFTDGQYDLEARSRETFYAPGLPLNVEGNAEAAIRRGRALLCENGGVADELHQAGTVVLTVGLGGGIAEEDQRFLESFSTGDGCGSMTEDGLGAWVSAEDLQGLVFAFDQASSGIAGGAVVSDEEITRCVREACPTGSTSFTLDESLSQFHLLVAAPDPLIVELEAPDGSQVQVEAGLRERVSGADIEVIALKAASIVDGQLPLPADWAGEWTVTFIDPTGEASGLLGRAHVVLFGGLTPVIEPETEARVGEPLSVVVRAVGEDGAPRIPEGFVSQIVTQLEAVDPTTGATLDTTDSGPGPEGWTYSVDVPSDLQSSSLKLRAVLDITTAGGIKLPSTQGSTTVAVAPPASYPRLDPAVIDFGATSGTDAATTTFRIVGGEDPGCVVLGDPTVDAGPRAQDAAIRVEGVAAGECLSVSPGESRSITVVLEHSQNVAADVEGALPVMLRSDASGDELTQEIPITGQFVRVVDATKRMELFISLLVLGALLPLLLLYALNRRSARFRRPAEERVATVDVRVGSTGVVERLGEEGDRPFWLASTDFAPLTAEPGNPRRFEAAGLSFASHVPWWPLIAPYGTASAAGGSTTSALGDVTGDDGRRGGRLPFGLSGQWVFVADEVDSGDRTGRLHVFLNGAVAFDNVADRLVQGLKLDLVPAVHGMPSSCFRTDDDAPTDGRTPPPSYEHAGSGSPASASTASDGGDSWGARYSTGPSEAPWVTDEEPSPRRRSVFKRRRGGTPDVDDAAPTDWTPPSTGGWTPPRFDDSDDA